MVLVHTVGNDPGSVNFGVCDITLDGMVYTENFEEEIPNVIIHNLELWNLKTRWGIRRKQGTSVFEKYHLGRREPPSNPLEKDDEAKDNIALWLSNMNYFVYHNEWLRKNRAPNNQLATLAIENQFDHIQSLGARTDMHTISHAFASSISMCDLERTGKQMQQQQLEEDEPIENPSSVRLIIKRALKYGVPHDGSLNYDQRKAEGIKVTFRLLEVLGYTEWVGFLNSVLASGQKLDDLCDAFLLALQTAVDLNTKLNKEELPDNVPRLLLSQRPLSSPLETITFPEIEVEAMPEKKKRTRKASTNTTTKKKKALPEDAIDNEVAIKRRKVNLSFNNDTKPPPTTFPALLLPSNNNNKRGKGSKAKEKLPALSIEILDDIEEC